MRGSKAVRGPPIVNRSEMRGRLYHSEGRRPAPSLAESAQGNDEVRDRSGRTGAGGLWSLHLSKPLLIR